jgi:hypothetical protein
LRFLGYNNFTNIWLIDAWDTMAVPSRGTEAETETGLLIYTQFLYYELKFGGEASATGQLVSNIFIQNITGPFNRMNWGREPFFSWDIA